jgi:hypothetical protein
MLSFGGYRLHPSHSDAANTISLFTFSCASSIFAYNDASPMSRAALLTCYQTYIGRRNLSTRFVDASNDTNDRPFEYVRQICYSIKRHSPSPFIDNLHQSKSRTCFKIVAFSRNKHLMSFLDCIHPFRYP